MQLLVVTNCQTRDAQCQSPKEVSGTDHWSDTRNHLLVSLYKPMHCIANSLRTSEILLNYKLNTIYGIM